MAEVVGIFICSAEGQPMQAMESVKAIEGRGLEGDRYERDEGVFSKTRKVVRHVSLIAAEAIAQANQAVPVPFLPAETRRNILTEGVDLNSLVGQEFMVGYVRMRGVELCEPCNRPSQLANKSGFKEAFADKGGLRAELLSTGIIHVGDSVGTGDLGLHLLEQTKKILKETYAALHSGTLDDLREYLQNMQILNTSFSYTKEFLKTKGLRSVAELDKDGMRELKDHLLAILYPPKS